MFHQDVYPLLTLLTCNKLANPILNPNPNPNPNHKLLLLV